mgnify:CR=1 FL=1
MSEDVFAHAGLADTHADLMRNIVSLRVSQDLFDDLSDRPADWDGLRDRALMVRARLERRGIDPAAAFGQVAVGINRHQLGVRVIGHGLGHALGVAVAGVINHCNQRHG